MEECGCFVEKCGCNVDPPHLHISQLDQVLPPPWSVILNNAIVDVMWIHQISTLTIKWTAVLFCRLYSSLHLLSVSWFCIWSLYCTRALALLYNVSLEALKSYAFALWRVHITSTFLHKKIHIPPPCSTLHPQNIHIAPHNIHKRIFRSRRGEDLVKL